MNEDYEVPLWNEKAEQMVIGSMLVWPSVQREMCVYFKAEDFYRGAHRRLFAVMFELYLEGKISDTILVEEKLGKQGVEDCGGWEYILAISTDVIGPNSVKDHAELVKEKARIRQFIAAANTAVSELRTGGDLSEIMRTMPSPKDLDYIDVEFVNAYDVDRNGKDTGVSTGYPCIDRLLSTGGYAAGQMACIVAKEKAGKSTLMIGSAAESCKAGLSVCYATFADLNKKRLVWRMLRYMSGFSNPVSAQEFNELDRYDEAVKEFEGRWDLRIYDGTKSSKHRDIDRFLNKLESQQEKKHPFDIVFIDYAQKLTTKEVSAANQVALGDYCSDVISACAERIGIPIIVGSQLTAGSVKEGRDPMTKGSRKWLEDCGLALMIEKGEGNARTIEIFRSRFGGDQIAKPFLWDDHFLKFKPVNPNL